MIWLWASLFFASLLVLSLLRRRLLLELSALSLLALGSARLGYWLYALIMFPGTVLHELSHWLVAEILRVRTGKIELIPDDPRDFEHRLGSVATARPDPLRGLLIGVAPFVTGLFALLVLGSIATSLSLASPPWQLGLVFYGILAIGNSLFLSRADLYYWPVLVVLILGVTALYLASPDIFSSSFQAKLTTVFTLLSQALWVTAGVSFAMISVLYISRRVVEKLLRKRVNVC